MNKSPTARGIGRKRVYKPEAESKKLGDREDSQGHRAPGFQGTTEAA